MNNQPENAFKRSSDHSGKTIFINKGVGSAACLRQFSIIWRIATVVRRSRWKRSVLLWLRFFTHPFLTFRWWRFLTQFSLIHKLPLPHDELIQKPFSKFLMHGITNKQRLDLLRDNFSIAQECLSKKVLSQLWKGHSVNLGSVIGRADEYRCTLALADLCGGRHEGAFAIRLVRNCDNVILWTVKFMFVRSYSEVGWTFAVGGMQGPRGGKQAMVQVTRDLHGLRPKDSLLLVLQGLLEPQTKNYFAVSHARHSINYRRSRRQKMLFSNVDSFWLERAAKREETFGFHVPVSSLAGNCKRSMIKRIFVGMGDVVIS